MYFLFLLYQFRSFYKLDGTDKYITAFFKVLVSPALARKAADLRRPYLILVMTSDTSRGRASKVADQLF
jgi:hypothetical protein